MNYHYTNACSQYGASMGRADRKPEHAVNDPERWYLQRISIDSGGYDPGGAYWGVGSRDHGYMYVAYAPLRGEQETTYQIFVRAVSRDAAKRAVRWHHATAAFYR